MKKTLAALAATILTLGLVAGELVNLRFQWDWQGNYPDCFNLYDSRTATGGFYLLTNIPGLVLTTIPTSSIVAIDPATNHFWFMTASNVLGEGLPSNVVTGYTLGNTTSSVVLKVFRK